MAEGPLYFFEFKEIAEALIQKQGIREGLWGIAIQFGLAGAIIQSDPPEETIVPAAIVPVLKIGLQRFDKPNSLTVDAAEVPLLSKDSPQPNEGTRKPRSRSRRTKTTRSSC